MPFVCIGFEYAHMYTSNFAKNVFRYSAPRKKMEERMEGGRKGWKKGTQRRPDLKSFI